MSKKKQKNTALIIGMIFLLVGIGIGFLVWGGGSNGEVSPQEINCWKQGGAYLSYNELYESGIIADEYSCSFFYGICLKSPSTDKGALIGNCGANLECIREYDFGPGVCIL